MEKVKAYTLMEMLVVMTIMIILLSVGIFSYLSFAKTTQFNQDVADIQNDVLIMQRAAMLFERDPDEYWLYGVGVDFGSLGNGEGNYEFFKWCSPYPDFGDVRTKSEYPNFDPEYSFSDTNGNIPVGISDGVCDGEMKLVKLSGYGVGNLNLDEDVSIANGRFLLFEAVSGKAFIYDSSGTLVDANVEIILNKGVGDRHMLVIKNLSGRIELINIGDDE
ncbi:type II secretion system GspH family protein [bacterium]|nr:type II secretion system GspH family protein [bacterium]